MAFIGSQEFLLVKTNIITTVVISEYWRVLVPETQRLIFSVVLLPKKLASYISP